MSNPGKNGDGKDEKRTVVLNVVEATNMTFLNLCKQYQHMGEQLKAMGEVLNALQQEWDRVTEQKKNQKNSGGGRIIGG